LFDHIGHRGGGPEMHWTGGPGVASGRSFLKWPSSPAFRGRARSGISERRNGRKITFRCISGLECSLLSPFPAGAKHKSKSNTEAMNAATPELGSTQSLPGA